MSIIKNEKQITEDYPKLFPVRIVRGHSVSIGIECGPGWYDIIALMCGTMQDYIDRTRKNHAQTLSYNRALKQAIAGNSRNLRLRYKKLQYSEEKITSLVNDDISANRERPIWRVAPKQVVFTQIKEKFGTLRVYTNATDSYCDGVIAMAESMSAHTCEVCSRPGKQTNTGWIKTLCDECKSQTNK